MVQIKIPYIGNATFAKTASELSECEKMKFFYDEEGNLEKKVEPNGDTWTYLYFGNGMLKQVIRPDRSGVSFQYDPIGRRMEKLVTKVCRENVTKLEDENVYKEKVIRFLWDGNTLLHEWKEDKIIKPR